MAETLCVKPTSILETNEIIKEDNQVTSQEIINSVSVFIVRESGFHSKKNNFCGLCHNKYRIGDRVACIPCGHNFHEYCIENWLKWVRPTCPIDKKSVIRGKKSNETVNIKPMSKASHKVTTDHHLNESDQSSLAEMEEISPTVRLSKKEKKEKLIVKSSVTTKDSYYMKKEKHNLLATLQVKNSSLNSTVIEEPSLLTSSHFKKVKGDTNLQEEKCEKRRQVLSVGPNGCLQKAHVSDFIKGAELPTQQHKISSQNISCSFPAVNSYNGKQRRKVNKYFKTATFKDTFRPLCLLNVKKAASVKVPEASKQSEVFQEYLPKNFVTFSEVRRKERKSEKVNSGWIFKRNPKMLCLRRKDFLW